MVSQLLERLPYRRVCKTPQTVGGDLSGHTEEDIIYSKTRPSEPLNVVYREYSTNRYLRGNTNRRGTADTLGVPAIEGIAVTQAIEETVYLLTDLAPAIPAD